MKSANKVVFSGIWYTISNFMIKGMVFLTVPIFARLMDKSQFGDYSNYTTWLHLLMVIVSFNLYASVNRARLDYPQQLDAYCSSILLFGTIITAGFYFFIYLNLPIFEKIFSVDRFYIHLMFSYLLVQPALEVFQIKQTVLYQYKANVAVGITSTFLTTAVSVLLVLFMEDKLKGRVIGYLFPLIFLNIIIYGYFIIKGRCFRLSYCKYALLYSWPFVPHLLANYILSASDRIMITNLCGNEFTATYTIACNCMSIATLFLTSLNNAVSPWIFDKLENNEEKDINKITYPYCLIFFLSVQLVMLIGPELLWILGGPQYSNSKSIIIPLLVSAVLQFAYCLYVNIEQYSRKTWAIAMGTAIAASVNIGLNFILLPIYGYWIAAYTTLIGYIILFLVHYSFVRIIGYKNIYNDKIVFFMILASILEQPLILLLYSHILIRYIIFLSVVLSITFLFFAKKDKIKRLLRKEGDY
ncbi:MAG: oligosaccharide flippase family protein [Clostridia bacterium]|nr:oligosaccharide flippase family protein [Clostridia bacterium]